MQLVCLQAGDDSSDGCGGLMQYLYILNLLAGRRVDEKEVGGGSERREVRDDAAPAW